MRRKQVLAILMAGALTVGMVPVSALAAGEEALSIEQEDGISEEGGEETENPVEEDVPVLNETPEELPQETPEETPEDEIPEETPEVSFPEELPENGNDVILEIPAAEAEETPTPAPEVKENSIKIGDNTFETLEAALAAASADETIVISGEFEVTETLVIPAEKSITIAAADETVIKRAAAFTGSLFQADGNFQFSTATSQKEDGTTVTGTLTVDGNTDTPVEGSLVEITGAGVFILNDGITLKGNLTSGNGGAIRNESETGTILLRGGAITENQAEQGGAVYTKGNVGIQGTVNVSGNRKTEGLEENNITLDGAAALSATGALTGSSLGVDVLTPEEGRTVVAIPEGVEGVLLADVLTQITYNGDAFAIDENGALKSTAVVEPTPTPEVVPLKLKPVSIAWTGYDSVEIVCNSNKDGKYFIKWVKKGDKAPSFDTTEGGNDVVADYNFTTAVDNLPVEEVDVYVCVLDNDGQHKAVKIEPNYKKRPSAPPTPTPEHVPVIPSVKDSKVYGLENPLEFYPGKFYPFRVVGAGTDNQNPGYGDVKWIPQYWSTSSNPDSNQIKKSWSIGAKENGIATAATYNMYVFFQKAVYDGTNWQMTDTIESATYQFKSKAIVITTATPTPTNNPYGGGNGGDGYYDENSEDGYDDPNDYSDEANDTKAAVATADESPVGSMLMLAFASLFTGGYVLVRRRKKESN